MTACYVIRAWQEATANHVKAELHACSPIDTDAPSTHDVEFAARIMIEQKRSIDEWRRT